MAKNKTFQISTGAADTVRAEINNVMPLVVDGAVGAVKQAMMVGGLTTQQPACEKDTELFSANITGVIEMPLTAKEKELRQAVFDVKLQYDTLINSLKPLFRMTRLFFLLKRKRRYLDETIRANSV